MIKTISLLIILLSTCAEVSAQDGVISKVITATELQKLIKDKSDLQLIDVRTIGEYKAGHLSKSVLIDYYKPDFKAQLQKLDKNKPIAVYCAIGGRSNEALQILKRLGFREAYDLSGGIQSWQENKLPIEK
jgi:rhodanese-related sulfurtransferase